MDIIKIIGVVFISLIISVILKEYKREYVIYISIISGAIIIFLCFGKLKEIIDMLISIANKSGTNSYFILLLLKITGIAILSEYAVSICKDAGENAIASKIDLGGKILIISISIPIISKLLETITKIM